MSGSPTIKDIAVHAGVSIATVSRVINSKPDVSQKARERVETAMDKLSYRPSVVARSLVLNKSHTIGLILPDLTNPFFPEIAQAVIAYARRKGYSVILSDLEEGHEGLIHTVEHLRERRADGIIFLQWSEWESRDPYIDSLIGEGVPMIATDQFDQEGSPLFDNFGSGEMAAQCLIDSGHRELACIAGDLSTIPGQQRLEGFRSACAQHGIYLREELLIESEFTINGGRAAAADLLLQHKPFTALFAANDLIAIGVYEHFRKMGVRIPLDVSVVGHDDIEFAQLVYPRLTTISVPRQELGIRCVDALLEKISRNTPGDLPPLRPEMRIRDSVRVL